MLIASGATYRRLEADGCSEFEGRGVFYAATLNEAPLCGGKEVAVVGGGNSAAQAAVYLSNYASKVYMVVRGSDLRHEMSYYLVDRIKQTPQIELLLNTVVTRMDGSEELESVEVLNGRTGERRTLRTRALFSFIGAVPHTHWLPAEIERDTKGFIQRAPRWHVRCTGTLDVRRSCSRPVSRECSRPATCDPSQ